jgi:putative SOS response-associated peptidase YedK
VCGRFSLTVSAEILIRKFQLRQSIVMVPRYNIAPSQVIPVMRTFRSLEFLRWGFKPAWMKLPPLKEGFVNARAETVSTKPAFRNAFNKRRCLIVADGYYEWKEMEGVKKPFYIQKKDKEVFALAGLWEEDTCVVLTTKANDSLSLIHERMPILIQEMDFESWLNPKADKAWVQDKLLRANEGEAFIFQAVSTKVNRVGFEGAECIGA